MENETSPFPPSTRVSRAIAGDEETERVAAGAQFITASAVGTYSGSVARSLRECYKLTPPLISARCASREYGDENRTIGGNTAGEYSV